MALLVDVFGASLPDVSRAEQPGVRCVGQALHELRGRGRLEMLRHFQAYAQIDLVRCKERHVQIDAIEFYAVIDHLRLAVPVAIESQKDLAAQLVTSFEPGAAAA